MESRARLLGHSIHQQLIPFPLGLLFTAVVFDTIHLVAGGAQWALVAYWMIAAGIVGGVLAAPFGFIDWRAIPAGTRAKRVGSAHGIGNLIVVALFTASWLLRSGEAGPGALALLLAYSGAFLSVVTGWLGGELVDRLGVAVDDGAHLDAPSSLSGRPARERSGADV